MAGGAYSNTAHRWYAVLVLMLAYACYGMDRALPGVLIEPIRHEFQLKDSQLGLLSMVYGLGFAAAALPMGQLSDRMNRRNLLVVIVCIWSLCTALGGVTRNFVQLLLARLGVGVSEAGASPVAIPMLSDIFPPERRSFMLSVFFMSAHFGSILAGLLGGFVAAEMGWRAAFLMAGLPGLLIGLLILTTVREPLRGGFERDENPAVKSAPSMLEVFAFLLRTPALICLMICVTLATLVVIVMGVWAGSFFIRVHGLSLKEVGLLLGLGGVVSTICPPINGWLADRLSKRDPRWTLRIVWISILLAFAGGLTMLFSPALPVAIASYLFADAMRSSYGPLIYSIMMSNTPVEMRGSVMSMVQLLSMLVGFGFGPMAIGFLSDFYGGGTGVRYAMANGNLPLLVVVVLLLTGSYLLYRKPRPPEIV